MKQIIAIFTLLAVTFFSSCNDEKTTVETTKETHTVIPAPKVVVKDPPSKATNINLDRNGVKVETKKVNVSIKNEGDKQ